MGKKKKKHTNNAVTNRWFSPFSQPYVNARDHPSWTASNAFSPLCFETTRVACDLALKKAVWVIRFETDEMRFDTDMEYWQLCRDRYMNAKMQDWEELFLSTKRKSKLSMMLLSMLILFILHAY